MAKNKPAGSHLVFLGLGSNINARAHITSAISCLREAFGNIKLSPFYRSKAFGFKGDDFINLVARVETSMSPLELKKHLGALENRHGRDREVPRYSDRTLDVDILLYDDLYLLSPDLEIPRGEILQAAYVLKPLADIAPDLVHPAAGKTLAELWQAFPKDEAPPRRISWEEN